MRFASLATILTFAAAAAASACSYNKQCFGDGVCKITKNGVVTYEGPPEKVAEYQAKEEGAKAAAAAIDQEYKDAPRRPADQPIRVVVIANASAANLVGLMPKYAAMLEQSLAASPRIQIVPQSKISFLLGGTTEDGKPIGGAAVDENLTRAVRDMSGAADVAIVLHADEKKESGFVSGGGGVGMAEVVRAELTVSMSSVYGFAPETTSKVGKSTAGISLSGLDKDGKPRTGELKSDRNVENDRPAVDELAAWTNQTIETKIAPDLPEQAAAAEIHKKHGNDLLKTLMGGK